ncbi:MAG: MaoC family dehydratase N-terminal domain-containing protein [Magnetococcus sp. YQC-9]
MIARLTPDEIHEQDCHTLEVTVTAEQIDRFAAVTGDISPLHMDAEFARQRGFNDRVSHGVLTLGFFSQLVGVHLPGENALLQSVNVRFLAPVYPSDRLRIDAVVDHCSMESGVIVLKIMASRCASDEIVAKGKIQVGFTQRSKHELNERRG